MTDLTPIAPHPEDVRPITATASRTREATSLAPVEKVPEPVTELPTTPSDRIKLSFTSQAKLLKQQGQNTGEIALNLGVSQQQVLEALQKSGFGAEPLTSLRDQKPESD